MPDKGGNFKHFKISIGHSRNWMVSHCVTCSHTDVRRQLKDRDVLQNSYKAHIYPKHTKHLQYNVALDTPVDESNTAHGG